MKSKQIASPLRSPIKNSKYFSPTSNKINQKTSPVLYK